MNRKYSGVVHGNKIELDESPDLADGERVEIELVAQSKSPWGEGIKRSAGALANDEEFSQAMQQIQRGRKTDSRPSVEL
jgi:hypothetical protein